MLSQETIPFVQAEAMTEPCEMHEQPMVHVPQKDEDWEPYRQDIVRLYSELGLPLKEVQKLMEATHHFKASKRMYLAKLKKWDTYKNYKAADKERLARMIAEAVADGRPVTSIRFRNKPVNMSKIRRHLSKGRAQQRTIHRLQPSSCNSFAPPVLKTSVLANSHVQSTLRDSSTSPSDSKASFFTPESIETPSSRSSSSGNSPTDIILQPVSTSCTPSHSINPSPEVINLELVLHQIQRFSTLSPSPASSSFSTTKIKTFWSSIGSAIYFLKKSSPLLAWPVLQSACSIAPTIIPHTNLIFLCDLFTRLSPSNTQFHPELRLSLLRYLAQLSYTSNGPTHPLTIICHQLTLPLSSHLETNQRSMRFLLATAQNRTRIRTSSVATHPALDQAVLQIRLALTTLLRRDRDLAAAEALALNLISTSERSYGILGDETCDALLELVYVYTDQGRYAKALKICTEVLERKKLKLGDEGFPDSRSSYAMENMAELHLFMGEVDECISWLRKALVSAWNIRGGTTSAMHVREKLEEMLVSKGRMEEAGRLRWEFPETGLEVE